VAGETAGPASWGFGLADGLARFWHFRGEALALNPYCPWDATDPENLN